MTTFSQLCSTPANRRLILEALQDARSYAGRQMHYVLPRPLRAHWENQFHRYDRFIRQLQSTNSTPVTSLEIAKFMTNPRLSRADARALERTKPALFRRIKKILNTPAARGGNGKGKK